VGVSLYPVHPAGVSRTSAHSKLIKSMKNNQIALTQPKIKKGQKMFRPSFALALYLTFDPFGRF
jgi:hypothetical protein